MAYMKDSTGRRLDNFIVPDRGLALFPGLVPVGSRSSWNGFNSLVATPSARIQNLFSVSDVIARPARNLRLVFDGWNWDIGSLTEKDIPNAYTIRGGIKLADGTVVPIFFNGARNGTVPVGGRLVSDAVPVQVNRGDVIAYRLITTVADTQTVVGNGYINTIYSAAEGYEHGATVTDKTLQSGNPVAVRPVPTLSLVPHVVLGEPLTSEPIVGIAASDSIAAGYTDDTIMASDGGYLRRALSGKFGFIRTASPSDLATNYVDPQKSPRRRAIAAGCTSVISQYGINDIKAGSRNLAQLQAATLTNATHHKAQGAAFFICTLLPNTSSTTAWTDTAGQTVGTYESVRAAYNAWLRAGAPIVAGVAVAAGTQGAILAGNAAHPIKGVFDPAAQVETGDGKWLPLGRSVNNAVTTAGSAAITSATAAFTAADLGKQIIIPAAGASGGYYVGYIQTVDSATQVTTDRNATASLPGAIAGIGPATMDGLHPAGSGNALAAMAIDTTKLV